MKKKKLTDTCWCFEKDGFKLAVVQPIGYKVWFVINVEGKCIFGPQTFDGCREFVEEIEVIS